MMNTRIDDLYRQARLDAGYERGFEATVQDVYQRFAQLIVRECAKIADIADENKCEWIGGNILTHFGVEE
jgi:uncharacterized protein YfbU (UPF0304 family)